MKNVNDDINLIYTIDKNNCFLNIIGIFDFVKKNSLKVQVAKLRIFYEMMDLHNF